MAEPWRQLGPFVTFYPLIIQIKATPNAAAVRPAIRKLAEGISKTDAIMRFMPSGNKAYNIPSMAIASARAVASSLIISIQSLPYWFWIGLGIELKNWNNSESGLRTIDVPGFTALPKASMER